MGDGATLLDVCHLPDTGYSIQHVSHLGAGLHAVAGTIQTAFQYSQIMMLKQLNYKKNWFNKFETWVFSTVFLSSNEQKSDEKRMT